MKLAILTTTGFVFCHTNDSHTTSNSENVDLGDDIRLTPCQAEKFTELGYQVDAFGPTEDNKRACAKKEKAQALGTKWDANWSARYFLNFCSKFDSTFFHENHNFWNLFIFLREVLKQGLMV